MDAPATFLLCATLAALGAIAIIAASATSASASRFARTFRRFCLALAITGLVGVVVVSLPFPTIASAVRVVLRITGYLGWLVVGMALSATFLAIAGRVRGRKPIDDGSASHDFEASSVFGASLSIYVAFAFFGFEVGKAAHDAEMRQFFLASGYPIWFMYVVMSVEIAGALALLTQRMRPIAAVLLGAVMVGAIATHWRNGDPFPDSLDALRMLLLVACFPVLEWQHSVGRPHQRRPQGTNPKRPAIL